LAYVLEEGPVFASEASLWQRPAWFWSGLGRNSLKRVDARKHAYGLIRPTTSLVANDIGPCFGSGPGDRPHSISFLFLTSPPFEGDGAPTRRTAWIARPEVARLAAGPWA
jgi:hypothetical protein